MILGTASVYVFLNKQSCCVVTSLLLLQVLTEGKVGGGDVEGEGWGLVDGVTGKEEEEDEEVLEEKVEQVRQRIMLYLLCT
jgi:hypothetical protein